MGNRYVVYIPLSFKIPDALAGVDTPTYKSNLSTAFVWPGLSKTPPIYTTSKDTDAHSPLHVEWTDARGSTPIEKLKPFLAEAPQPPTALYTILHPPLSDTDTMTANPVTEICLLPFPSNLSAAESRELNAQLIDFRIAQLEQLPQAERPKSCSMGHIDRPSTVHHDSSPSGRAMLHVLAVGWESVEAHMKAKKTDQFTQSIAPIRKKVLPPVPGLEMRHVSFKKIE